MKAKYCYVAEIFEMCYGITYFLCCVYDHVRFSIIGSHCLIINVSFRDTNYVSCNNNKGRLCMCFGIHFMLGL